MPNDMPSRYADSKLLYRHFKGGLYLVDGFAQDAGREDRGTLVLYHSVSDPTKQWARPLSEWNETVPSVRTPTKLKTGDGLKRFTPERITDKIVEELWGLLEDVPFYETENAWDDLMLEQDWFLFPKSTERDTIWHWFDDHHSKGIHYLLYGEREDDNADHHM